MNELGNTPSKAEQRALEAYPVKMCYGPIGHELPMFDFHEFARVLFIEGYEQAEKDLALTWEDVRIISIIIEHLEGSINGPLPGTQEFYEEVLKRFKEKK